MNTPSAEEIEQEPAEIGPLDPGAEPMDLGFIPPVTRRGETYLALRQGRLNDLARELDAYPEYVSTNQRQAYRDEMGALPNLTTMNMRMLAAALVVTSQMGTLPDMTAEAIAEGFHRGLPVVLPYLEPLNVVDPGERAALLQRRIENVFRYVMAILLFRQSYERMMIPGG